MPGIRTVFAGLLVTLVVTSCVAPFQALKVDGSEAVQSQSNALTGTVLGMDGKPAAGVVVHGHLISNNSGGLIGIYGSKFRIQAAELETRTDSQGRFTLREPNGQPLNVEAVLSDEVKAIQLNVASSTSDLQLQLAYTGSISGQVTAPSAPGVTDFEGVDVFVPGTSYIAKTTSAGRYVLSNVAAGSFSLVASKSGLGRGHVHGVKVEPKQTTSAPDLELSVAAPSISSITPSSGGRGTEVTLRGEKFAASTGEPFQVVFGGATATSPKRLDDQTIQVTVPSGATSGDVVISVAGIPSNQGAFTVLDALFIGPNIRFLGLERTQRYHAWAKDTAGRTVLDPAVQWQGESGITVKDGEVFGASAGNVTLLAKSGELSQSLGIQVLASAPMMVNTFAGSKPAGLKDDWGPQASFNYPHGVALGPDGNLYVADRLNHRIRRITPHGMVTTFAGTGDSGRQNGPALEAQFFAPVDLVFDKIGNLYVTEEHAIRKITPEGTVSTLAGHFMGFPGFADSTDGTMATFRSPHGIALGPDDHLYVADYLNHAVRRVSLTGAVSTVAGSGTAGFNDATGASAQFSYPIDVAVNAQGRIFVSDSGNHRIRAIDDGVVSTYAGTAAYGFKAGMRTEAIFYWPHGLALDAEGNLFITDTGNHHVRKIDLAGNVMVVAGHGMHLPSSHLNASFTDGTGNTVTFDEPFGLCVDAKGRIFVGDRKNNRVRVISP